MTRAEITTFFERREQAWRSRDAATLASGHTQDGTVISPMFGTIHGRPAIEKAYRDLFVAFQDWEYSSQELISDGDRVAHPYIVRATHSSDFFGVPATGRRFEIQGVTLCAMEQNLIRQERRIYDFTALLIQIGVLKAKPR